MRERSEAATLWHAHPTFSVSCRSGPWALTSIQNVKQITEIDDARLVKGLAHPLRIHILRVLENRVASPSEIADEIDAPLGNVSYHVRFLARVGLIELASTKPRRGAVEHYYRAAGRVEVTHQAWAQVPQVVKSSLHRSALEQIGKVITAAAGAGGFDQGDPHVGRQTLALDPQGFTELSAEVQRVMERANAIAVESAARHAKADGEGARLINADLVTMLFETPRAPTPVRVDGKARRGRSAKR